MYLYSSLASLFACPWINELVINVLKNPAVYVKLFRSNPEAFMLEAARFYPPVGGIHPQGGKGGRGGGKGVWGHWMW